MTIDRNNQDSVAEVIKDLIPEGMNPQKCLEFLADSISMADILDSNRWGVTLKKKLIRLNVGMIEVLFFIPGVVYCVLDLDNIPRKLWKDGRVKLFKNENDPAIGFYKSVPSAIGCNILIEDLEGVLPLIQDSHRLLVVLASQTRIHPMTKIGHSPAVIDYLSSYLGRNIPQPAYFLG